MRVPFVFVLSASLLSSCADASSSPRILSAFFGLDDALPPLSAVLCPSAPGMDGMPVVFAAQIDAATLDAADFAVVTRAGVVKTPVCATLAPASESDELRTVLLIGDLGGVADPPLRVDVVDDLRSVGGASLRGATLQPVTPLADGPSLVLAERVAMPDPELDGIGGCPSAGTQQVVTVTWSGGVRDPAGGQAFDVARYRVTLADGTEIAPASLADLGDNDNVQDLCLASASPARSVRVLATTAIDPGGDANPETTVSVP